MSPEAFAAAQAGLARGAVCLVEDVPDGHYFFFDGSWWLKQPAHFATRVEASSEHSRKCSFKWTSEVKL